jgi:hypothetical protein
VIVVRLVWISLQWLMTAAFLFSVVVQWNDPDPIRWMAIYGAAAAVSGWAALAPAGYPWWLPVAVAVVALIWSLTLLPQVVGKVRLAELFESWEMKSPRVEVAREAGGLMIVAVWMALTAVVRLAFRV